MFGGLQYSAIIVCTVQFIVSLLISRYLKYVVLTINCPLLNGTRTLTQVLKLCSEIIYDSTLHGDPHKQATIYKSLPNDCTDLTEVGLFDFTN